ncbi:MAG: hypothetical protein IJX57_02255 [Clostridia bacterium]|nr:hypothetical protein [Clostridia bacterium]
MVMFFPVRHVFKDGGSVSYESLIYEVKDYRSLPDENGEALRGKTIKILGFEVYNGTYTITIKK